MILDYGTDLVSVEVKSSTTMNYDFLKGLNYYNKLAGEVNNKQFLVYGGDTSYETNGTKIYSYKDLDELFSEINE